MLWKHQHFPLSDNKRERVEMLCAVSTDLQAANTLAPHKPTRREDQAKYPSEVHIIRVGSRGECRLR